MTKVYIVASNHGDIKGVYEKREHAEQVANWWTEFRAMGGDREWYKVIEKEVDTEPNRHFK